MKPIELIAVIVVGIFVVVGLSSMVSRSAEDAKAPVNGTMSAMQAAGVSDMDVVYCKFMCADTGMDLCTSKRPSGDVCVVGADGKKTCGPKPNCAEIYGLEHGVPLDSSSSGTQKVERATFSGVFLPGGKVNILLPESMKKDYVKDNFQVKLTDSGTTTWDCNNAVDKAASLCRSDFSDKDKIYIILPYTRDSNNIETTIKERATYKIKLLGKDSKGDFQENGTKTFSWYCPLPNVSANPLYAPGAKVVFNFTSWNGEPWIDYDKYSGGVNVEVGTRDGKTAGCYDPPDSPSATLKPTCKIAATAEDKKGYVFLMPYVMPGAENIAVSYPVYAKGITIGAGVPMCRAWKDLDAWNCPATACYKNADNKVFLLSTPESSGKYAANVACTYSATAEQCTFGCRSVPGTDSAECVLPKPDIMKTFIRAKKADVFSQWNFDKTKGEYVLNKDFILTSSSFDRLWLVVAVKNNAKAKDIGKDAEIAAGKITVSPIIGSTEVKSLPIVYLQTKDGRTLASESTALGTGGQYLEYEFDLEKDKYSEAYRLGTHTGTASEKISDGTKIASDSLLSSAYSYSVLNDCCGDCSCKAADVCGTCGTNPEGKARCRWNAGSGETSAFCEKAA